MSSTSVSCPACKHTFSPPSSSQVTTTPSRPLVGIAVIVTNPSRPGYVLVGTRKGSHGAGTLALPGQLPSQVCSAEINSRERLIIQSKEHSHRQKELTFLHSNASRVDVLCDYLCYCDCYCDCDCDCDCYYCLGGHLEYGETWSECGARELKEETNIGRKERKQAREKRRPILTLVRKFPVILVLSVSFSFFLIFFILVFILLPFFFLLCFALLCFALLWFDLDIGELKHVYTCDTIFPEVQKQYITLFMQGAIDDKEEKNLRVSQRRKI